MSKYITHKVPIIFDNFCREAVPPDSAVSEFVDDLFYLQWDVGFRKILIVKFFLINDRGLVFDAGIFLSRFSPMFVKKSLKLLAISVLSSVSIPLMDSLIIFF
jgi:hypothetical protein